LCRRDNPPNDGETDVVTSWWSWANSSIFDPLGEGICSESPFAAPFIAADIVSAFNTPLVMQMCMTFTAGVDQGIQGRIFTNTITGTITLAGYAGVTARSGRTAYMVLGVNATRQYIGDGEVPSSITLLTDVAGVGAAFSQDWSKPQWGGFGQPKASGSAVLHSRAHRDMTLS
jgi:hypothetical protein